MRNQNTKDQIGNDDDDHDHGDENYIKQTVAIMNDNANTYGNNSNDIHNNDCNHNNNNKTYDDN